MTTTTFRKTAPTHPGEVLDHAVDSLPGISSSFGYYSPTLWLCTVVKAGNSGDIACHQAVIYSDHPGNRVLNIVANQAPKISKDAAEAIFPNLSEMGVYSE